MKDYIVKYEDKGAELSFVNVFTDAVNMCPSAKVGDEITYTCTFNVTISMAKVPQTTIWFK